MRNTAPTEETNKKPALSKSRNDSTFLIRLLAVGYVLYMLYDIVSGYIAGGEDAPPVLALVLGIVVLGGGAIGILIISIKQYRRNKEEAARQAEEAAALEAAEEEEEAEEDWEEAEEAPAPGEKPDTLS